MWKPQLGLPCCNRTPKTHGCLNTLHPNPRDEFYNLLGSCGGALGGWRAGDQVYQAHLLPLFVCFDLCKSSTWSRPKLRRYKRCKDRTPVFLCFRRFRYEL
ncbi:hypothetical protein Taro_054881 [Colocasia esculenta]|uniref:Uncharacterized protein n=1 Tax=Colocasia esculenta TaxID=4460 RepID=A0A843XRB4_COLES|nr:hypothetical protein [Colocasia esculenta]